MHKKNVFWYHHAVEDLLVYRRLPECEKWHFCSNCSDWPKSHYIEIHHPEHLLKGSLCLECVTKRHHNEGLMAYAPSHLQRIPPYKEQA